MFHRLLNFVKFRSKKVASSFSPEQEKAHEYWKECSNSFLAHPEYYEKCEEVLRETILPHLGAPKFLLDVGCGNGRLTSILAAISQHVDAFDLSPHLIAQAKQNAQTDSIKNIQYKVSDIVFEDMAKDKYCVGSCMGVISTIIDEWALEKLLNKITMSLANGGYLILRDTLSTTEGGKLIADNDYTTRYRNQEDYMKIFESRGYETILKIPLVESSDYINAFFLLKIEKK